MGHSNSKQQIIEFQSNYLIQGPKQHRFFGAHLLLTKKNDPQELLIRKEFIFRSGQDQYQKIQRKPFNLIYPIFMISSGSMEHCSTVKELYVYFQIVGKPLIQIVKKQGPLSEAKAWFLLNQLSKSVQILEENGRAHWAISPQTVYRNKNENYLLYDSFFVVGPDPSNFLNSLKDSREPLSQKTVNAINRGVILSQTEGHQEDMYGMGLTLFFAVTGIHGRNLPPFPKKYQVMDNIMMQRRAFIGQQLIRLIKQLTQRQVLRRLNNHQLRRLLRQRQTEIIKKETLEYQIMHRSNMHTLLKLPERQIMNRGRMEESKRHTFNSPDRIYNQKNMFPNEHSSNLDLRVMHKSNNLNVTPPSVSQNYESTWETKRSAILPCSRHDITIEKNRNLTRILSYDKLVNKS